MSEERIEKGISTEEALEEIAGGLNISKDTLKKAAIGAGVTLRKMGLCGKKLYDYYKGEKDDDDEPAPPKPEVNTVEVIVAKNRHGETGTVEFAWDGEHTLFIPLERDFDD